jgi:hypothetical protein
LSLSAGEEELWWWWLEEGWLSSSLSDGESSLKCSELQTLPETLSLPSPPPVSPHPRICHYTQPHKVQAPRVQSAAVSSFSRIRLPVELERVSSRLDRDERAANAQNLNNPLHSRRMSFLSRLLVPRSIRRSVHPLRTVKRAATPKSVKKVRRLAHPVSNATYPVTRSLNTKRRPRSRSRVYRHGTCTVNHRTPQAAAKCRQT